MNINLGSTAWDGDGDNVMEVGMATLIAEMGTMILRMGWA